MLPKSDLIASRYGIVHSSVEALTATYREFELGLREFTPGRAFRTGFTWRLLNYNSTRQSFLDELREDGGQLLQANVERQPRRPCHIRYGMLPHRRRLGAGCAAVQIDRVASSEKSAGDGRNLVRESIDRWTSSHSEPGPILTLSRSHGQTSWPMMAAKDVYRVF